MKTIEVGAVLSYGGQTCKNGGRGLLPREQRPIKNWSVQCWVALICSKLKVTFHENGLPMGEDAESIAIRELVERLERCKKIQVHQENGANTGDYLWFNGISFRDTGTCTHVDDESIKRTLTIPDAFETGWYRTNQDGNTIHSTHGPDWEPEKLRAWLLAPVKK